MSHMLHMRLNLIYSIATDIECCKGQFPLKRLLLLVCAVSASYMYVSSIICNASLNCSTVHQLLVCYLSQDNTMSCLAYMLLYNIHFQMLRHLYRTPARCELVSSYNSWCMPEVSLIYQLMETDQILSH